MVKALSDMSENVLDRFVTLSGNFLIYFKYILTSLSLNFVTMVTSNIYSSLKRSLKRIRESLIRHTIFVEID